MIFRTRRQRRRRLHNYGIVDEFNAAAKEIDPNNNPSYGVLRRMSVMGFSCASGIAEDDIDRCSGHKGNICIAIKGIIDAKHFIGAYLIYWAANSYLWPRLFWQCQ